MTFFREFCQKSIMSLKIAPKLPAVDKSRLSLSKEAKKRDNSDSFRDIMDKTTSDILGDNANKNKEKSERKVNKIWLPI